MGSSRTTSDLDLLLDRSARRQRRSTLEQALRAAIRDGRLPAGTALPSSRALARDVGMARSTVSEAYAQLTIEGFLTARHGSGTWVAAGAGPSVVEDVAPPPVTAPRFDLRPGAPDLSSFPRALWLRAVRRALEHAAPDALASGDPGGRPELRMALARYLARARRVVAPPSRIVVCNGFSQGLKLVCDALRRTGARRIAVEDPSVFLYPPIIRASGLEIVPIPVDGEGLEVDRLGDAQVDAVLVTPAHQFPLGSTMSPARRTALLGWAASRDSLVIEDDYDGEFRYDRRPVGALHALDPDRVVYAGTAAKTLAPGVRLAWLVMPPSLLQTARDIRAVADRYSPVLDQLALADLIETGHFDRHVRRMRSRYRRRRDELVSGLAEVAPTVRIRGVAAGLQAVLELPDGSAEDVLVSRARRRSLGLHGLGAYRHGAYQGPQALVIGYGSPAEHDYAVALRELQSLLAAGVA